MDIRTLKMDASCLQILDHNLSTDMVLATVEHAGGLVALHDTALKVSAALGLELRVSDEVQTAVDAELSIQNGDWPNEYVVLVANGNNIHCPAHPEECSYVRVVDNRGEEVAYWTRDEWRESPEEVMGALLGATSLDDPE